MEDDKQITQVYDEFVIKHRAAYAGFKSIYQDKNPMPPLMKADRSDWYIALGVTAIVVASVLVSGSRTIVEFGGGLIGVSAFVMLECAVVAYAFIYTKNNINDERIDDVRKLTNKGKWLALIVAVVANVHATLKQNGVISSDVVSIVILLLVGISAPLLAYISGDIAGLEYMKALSRGRKIDEHNRGIIEAWQDGLNRAWAGQQKQWGVKVDMAPEPVQSSVQPVQLSDGHTGHGQGYSRESKAASIVRQHLDSHPEDMSIPVRELAEKLSVGKSTVASVVRDVKNGVQA